MPEPVFSQIYDARPTGQDDRNAYAGRPNPVHAGWGCADLTFDIETEVGRAMVLMGGQPLTDPDHMAAACGFYYFRDPHDLRTRNGMAVHVSNVNVQDWSTPSPYSEDVMNRLSCMRLVKDMPSAALPETKEMLTELRDHYHALEHPSIQRPTPPPKEGVRARVLSVE